MDISHLLTDTVTRAPKTGVSGTGDPKYGATSDIDARIEQQKQLESTDEGQTRDVKTVFLTDETINSDDVVWLPGENTADPSAGHRVEQIERADPLVGGPELKRVTVQ